MRLDNDSTIHLYRKSDISHSRDTVQRNNIAFCLLKSQRMRLADDRLKGLHKESWKWSPFFHSHAYRLAILLLVYIAAPTTAWQMESRCRELRDHTQTIVPRIDFHRKERAEIEFRSSTCHLHSLTYSILRKVMLSIGALHLFNCELRTLPIRKRKASTMQRNCWSACNRRGYTT